MKKLLSKAQERKPKKRTSSTISKEEIELALAWVRDEVTLTQVAHAYGIHQPAAYLKLAITLRYYIQHL